MVRGAVLAAVIAVVVAAPARAGTYQVRACAGGANNAWVPFSSNAAAFVIQPGCPFTAITASSASARAGFFEAAWWRLTAPPGTVVDRLRIARYGYRFIDATDNPVGGINQGGWISEAYTEDGPISAGFAREGCLIGTGQYLCDWGSKDPAAAVDLDLDAQQVTYQVACIRGSGCRSGSDAAFPLAAVTIHNAVATIRDDTPPALTAAGPLLQPGWHRPDTPVVVRASDTTGISAVTAGAGAASGSLARACDFTRTVPCTSVADAPLRLNGLADGMQRMAVTARDAAGNPTTRTFTVGVDGTPPAVTWRRTGRTLVAEVSDPLSGVAAGQIAVDGRPLPTKLAKGRLAARLPAGLSSRSRVTVSVTDVAGNTAAGVPPRVVIGSHKRVRNGHRVVLRGKVTTPAGAPLARVPVQATAAIRRRGAPAQPAGATATNARGRFVLRLPRGPSRTVLLTVPATGDLLPTTRGVSVRVAASSTIHPSRRTVRPGQRVRFSGTVRRAGQRVPARGLVVILQGRSAGAWRTFDDVRTTRSGRWSASYRFRVPGRYPVRVRIRRHNGFPFELGYSRATTIRVR